MSLRVEVDLRPMLGAVRDQGPRQTCLAHASTLAHENRRRSNLPLSPEYLHFFATLGGSRGGATIVRIANALRQNGQCTENDCPYLTSDPHAGWMPSAECKAFRRESESKRANFSEVESAIRAGSTPVLGISLPYAFFVPTSPWIIPYLGPIRALHAVAGVGIGSIGNRRLILIRNSWGPSWADLGHAWLDSDFLSHHLKDVLLLTLEVT
jgi:hypothetical protein